MAAAVVVVIFTVQQEHVSVLLIERAAAPCKGEWALPGGVLHARETFERKTGSHLVFAGTMRVALGRHRDVRGYPFQRVRVSDCLVVHRWGTRACCRCC